MRRSNAAGGSRRFPKSSLPAPDQTPMADHLPLPPRNLDFSALSRRDSDAISLCSSRPSSVGVPQSSTFPNILSDKSAQSAALKDVNSYLSNSLSAHFTLRSPLPSAKDIISAFRLLLDRLHYPLPDTNTQALEEDLFALLRLLSCPVKLTRSALKAPGTPHSFPPLLAVLHWLTQLALAADSIESEPVSASSNDLLAYITHSYGLFISGDDDTVADLDEEYSSKARAHAVAAAAAVDALEKEAVELEAKKNTVVAGPTRRELAEKERETLKADVRKFETVVGTWEGKREGMEAAMRDLEAELATKEREGRRLSAENVELKKKVEAQGLNVREADRMRREMAAVERDIAEVENAKAGLEEKAWVLEAAIVRKLEELEVLTEQCNQPVKK